MSPIGIVLYGPPASGKDTITAALNRLDSRFVLLPKLKVGTGRTEGYVLLTAEELTQLRDAGRLIAETHRYGNIYAIDRRAIDSLTSIGVVPVVHMGNIGDLRRLIGREPDSWLRVLLWTPREVTEQRSRNRGDADTGKRLAAWDETLADLETNTDDGFFQLHIKTNWLSADAAAEEIMTTYDLMRTARRSHEEANPL
ncbi:guanylate kinase [Streptosporangium algeriense]|uniref:Guanylate kinase n=1 Tax=Streptosporangium algeriense TaxID=1682748 RepID=A0ABW3DGM3_9ACTN